jgi:group I intron endonuclease
MRGIYFIKNLITNQLYVGSAINFYHRFATHKSYLQKGTHPNPKLQNSWNKYGEKNFRFQIETLVENKNDLVLEEQRYLDFFKEINIDLFNICPIAGSQLGFKHSDKTKKQFSEQRKGNIHKLGKKESEDTKKRKSIARIGSKNPNFGKVFSKEHIQKLSIAAQNRTEEHKKKISESLKGHIPWNKGKKFVNIGIV